MSLTEALDFLSPYPRHVRATALGARALVLNLLPEAVEQFDSFSKLIAYGFDRTYKGTVCVIMPLESDVNLSFPRGDELPDPDGLLTGSGKYARHVRLCDPEDARRPALRALLEASIALTMQHLAAQKHT
jgi:hypothetical protein